MTPDPDVFAAVLRALSFVALFQAAGTVFFLAIFGAQLQSASASIHRLAMGSALTGALLLLTQQSLEAARMAGEFSGLTDTRLQQLAWSSTSGIAHLVQCLALLLVVPGLWRHDARRRPLAIAGAVLAVLAFLLTGHTSVHHWRSVLAPLLAVHLLIVAFWAGSLLPLILVMARESRGAAVQILARFSTIAGWLVPGILIAGLGMALLLITDWSVLRQGYGLLLLAKLAGYAALLSLAAWNRWRLLPALADAKPLAPAMLRRSVTAEALLIIVVLSLSAVLTLFFSPESM